MTGKRRVLALMFTGFFAVFIAISVNWFFNNFEYKAVEKTTGPSTQARRNKFLAAEYYLRDLGFDVESDSNRARLLETHTADQTILLNDYGPRLSPTRFKALKKWLESGGHLILTANEFQSASREDKKYSADKYRPNQLLEEYGIHARFTRFDENKPLSTDDNTSRFGLDDGLGLSLEFSPFYQLLDTKGLATFSLKDQYGYHLLQFDIGDGKLTVLSDNAFLRNNKIGDNDHAYFLWLLSKVNRSPSSKLLLLYDNQPASIFTLIWKNGKEACIACLLLLIFTLWSMANRFGPVLQQKNYSKRNIVEHLSAVGRFSWRQDRGIRLLKQSRFACEKSLLARYPALNDMSAQERLKQLAEILDIAPDIIHKALYDQPASTHDYIESTHQLQKLWITQ